MKFKVFFVLFGVFFAVMVNAQSLEKVLFTVGDTPIYTSEFLNVYNKNLGLVKEESQKNIDEYLDLFINFKLKIKEAKALGLDKKPSYLREFSSYKKQLIKNFIRKNEVTEALVKEAYQRISFDVNANHILIKLPVNALPKDTLFAYNNILKLRERAINEGFDYVRETVHNGKTIYGEKLGYFSGFKMVYDFETVAFNTPVGEISMPFRTSFGYHILQVLDKRKSRGERTVAHIMVADVKGDSIIENAESRILKIYKKIKQGEDFKALAKQFSDDKNSAIQGGLLPAFSSGALSAQEFEDAAFQLKNIGEVSKPFKTQHGWHIVKLYAKKTIPEFEAIKNELIGKVKRDERSKLIDNALIQTLKVNYGVSKNDEALVYFESLLNFNYFNKTWTLPANFKRKNILFKINEKEYSYNDFANYLLKTQRFSNKNKSLKTLVLNKYEAFLGKHLLEYYENNLEFENKDFAFILNEYREGLLLLFDIMDAYIWNVEKTDTVKINAYYKNNKSKYVFPKRIEAIVASASTEKTLKKVAKFLKKGTHLNEINTLINKKDNIDVIFTSKTIKEGDQLIPTSFSFKKGLSKIYKHNKGFVLLDVKNVLPETQKTFTEAKGRVVNDYQVLKEANWIKQLKNKYKVVVNQEVLTAVKNQIKK